MDLRAWIGLLFIVVYVGGGYLTVRAWRRAGVTQSFGHPVLDQFLLLASGVALVVILALTFYRPRDGHSQPVKERVIA